MSDDNLVKEAEFESTGHKTIRSGSGGDGDLVVFLTLLVFLWVVLP